MGKCKNCNSNNPLDIVKSICCYLKELVSSSSSDTDLLQEIADNTGSSATLLTDMSLTLGDIKVAVENTDDNTVNLEARLDSLIALSLAGNISLTDMLLELQDILVQVSDINDNTDEIEVRLQTIIDKLDSLIAEKDVELVITTPIKICYDDSGTIAQHWVREKIEYDSEAGAQLTGVTEYSSDGITWSNTVPTGTVTSCELINSYNDNGGELITATKTYLAADDYHSITVTAIDDTVEVNGSQIPEGLSPTWNATHLLINDTVVTISGGGSAYVHWIKK